MSMAGFQKCIVHRSRPIIAPVLSHGPHSKEALANVISVLNDRSINWASYAPGAGSTAAGPPSNILRRYHGPANSNAAPRAIIPLLSSSHFSRCESIRSSGTTAYAGNSTNADCFVHRARPAMSPAQSAQRRSPLSIQMNAHRKVRPW